MKIGRLKQEEENRYEDDVKRLVDVFASYGILIPESDLITAWRKHSDEIHAAGWIGLPESDEEIYLAIIDYFEVKEW